MANLPQMRVTNIVVERLQKMRGTHDWAGALTISAQNDDYLALGYAPKLAIANGVRFSAEGEASAEADLPLQAQHRFLLCDQKQFDWAKSQAETFLQTKGVWQYSRFLKALSEKGIKEHSSGSKPSAQITRLGGEVVYRHFLHGAPPHNGLGQEVCYWVEEESLVTFSRMHSCDGKTSLDLIFDGNADDLRAQAVKFMTKKFGPEKLEHACVPRSAKPNKKPDKHLPKTPRDLMGRLHAEPIRPMEVTLFETVMRYAAAFPNKCR